MSEIIKEVLLLGIINLIGFATVGAILRLIYKQSLVFKIYVQLVPGLFVFATILFIMGHNSVFNITSTLAGLSVGVPVLVTSIIFVALRIIHPLKKTIENLDHVAQTALTISSELSEEASKLSKQSTEQASSVQETSSSLEEIGGMVRSNLDNANQAHTLSNQAKDISLNANNSMETIKRFMEQLLESNQRIEQLAKVIENIKSKTEIMDEIVFQTKLLSFNASVEAERAGEHGRGFAVVAQEVGNLAQLSGKSAQEIAVIVKDSMNEAIQVTANNRTKVEECNKTVLQTAELFGKIKVISETVSSGSKQVLSASEEQSKGIEQINQAMTQIEKAIVQSSTIADNASQATNQLVEQVQELNQAVDELKRFV